MRIRRRPDPGRRPQPTRKPPTRYHHGDLRRALIGEAVRTIRDEGANALTLRKAGKRLGVSRTALYRHFRDKSALLAAVARDGLQRFHHDLLEAWNGAGGGRTGFTAMGLAYVRFAVANPSHYRVMFGGFRDLAEKDPGLLTDGAAAFAVLLGALKSLRESGELEDEGSLDQLAEFIWATVHGVAMLVIDGQLDPEPVAERRPLGAPCQDPSALDALVRFCLDRLNRAIGLS